MMNLAGITNTLVVEPAAGRSTADVQRGLFALPGVASVQPVRAFTDTIRNALNRFLGILSVVEAAVLLLALLIAFNSASINVDERARENATMLAFGLPLRSVVRMGVVESVMIGLLGTGVGLGAGWLLLDWIIQGLVPRSLPDLGLVTALSLGTVITAVVLGVVAVALAPLLTVRKLARMDLPSTLRVME
jgi:putative ABC transport system permease protein